MKSATTAASVVTDEEDMTNKFTMSERRGYKEKYRRDETQ